MCGISGKLYFDPARSVEREVLERFDINRVGAQYLSLYEELQG